MVQVFSHKGKSYAVDEAGFLIDHEEWDENFAEGMAAEVKIQGGLTEEHWEIIWFIRRSFEETGVCPLVYQTCKANGLYHKDLKRLFPSGYLRGACILAGITYKKGYVNYFRREAIGTLYESLSKEERLQLEDKVCRVDVRGFLIDPSEWDKNYAINKAHEMKLQGGLSERHWKIINFLRESFKRNDVVPTVAETCEANGIELDELHELFPDGYHRGAVKIAGLKVR